MCTLILRRIVAECRSIRRKRKVIVNGLWTMNVCDRITLGCQELGNPVGGGSGIVPSDGHEKFDIVVLEEDKVEVLLKLLVSRFETAHFEIGTTPVPETVSDEEIEILSACVLAEEA